MSKRFIYILCGFMLLPMLAFADMMDGKPSAPTRWIIAKGAIYSRSIASKFGDYLTIKDFGPTGTLDDTATFQAAIDASCLGHKAALVNQIFTIRVPLGIYNITQLNATNCSGFSFWGDGQPSGSNGGTILRKIPAISVNAVFDMTGSTTGYSLKNFLIQASSSDGDTPYPAMGLLLASSALNPNNGNFNHIDNVSIAGRFSVAALYMYGDCCSDAIQLGIQQVNPNSSNIFGWIYANSNIASVTSSFTTIATGAQGASGFSCYRCEVHSFTGSSTVSGPALELDGARTFTYNGGILAAANNIGGIVVSKNASTQVSFIGTSFYTDQGPVALNAFATATGTVKNLVFINPDVTLGVSGALTSFAGFASGSILNGIININGTVSNYHFGGIGTAPTLSGGCSGGTIAGSDLGGIVLEGSSVTTCNITFATTFDFNRSCTVTPETAGAVNFGYSVSSSVISVTHNSANLNFNYICNGN